MKIAVFRALKLGDMLCSIPALKSLRFAYPKAEITLIGLPWAEDFVKQYAEYFDRFIPFPGWPGLPEQELKPEATVASLHNIQQEQFDLVLQMQGDGTIVNEMIALFDASETAGFYIKGNFCPNDKTYLPYPKDAHEIEKHLLLMQHLGIETFGTKVDFPISQEAEKEFQEIRHHFILPNTYAVIHPGAISGYRYDPQHFAYLADVLSQKGLQIVLTGTEQEFELCETVRQHMTADAINLCGKTSLSVLSALIKHASLFISSDTGVAHIATALDTPSIIIFEEDQIKRWAPLDRMLHKVVTKAQAEDPDVILRLAVKLLKRKADIVQGVTQL